MRTDGCENLRTEKEWHAFPHNESDSHCVSVLSFLNAMYESWTMNELRKLGITVDAYIRHRGKMSRVIDAQLRESQPCTLSE